MVITKQHKDLTVSAQMTTKYCQDVFKVAYYSFDGV